MKTRARPLNDFDLLLPRVGELRLKDQRELMERPYFSLSKRKRLKPIEYKSPDGETWVHVSANPSFGIATIWDADILIWAASHLNQLREQGRNDIPRTIRVTPHELLKAIQRDTGGRGYKELEAALQRLEATTIQTSVRAASRKRSAQFGWLDEWTIEADAETGVPRGMTITLSNWMFEGIMSDRSLLTMHPAYFTLSGGLERAIYRIARKHAGDQPGGWVCRVSVLHEKTGSDSPLKQFSYLLKKLVTPEGLLDYETSFVTAGDGSTAVYFVKEGARARAELRREIENDSARARRRAEEDARAAEVDALLDRRRV